VHVRGEAQVFLGGEPVFDEHGNQVFTGTDPFTHAPDQAQIDDRRQTVYVLVQSKTSKVAIDAPLFNAPSQTFANGIDASTTLNVAALTSGYTLTASDQVSVTLYDGTDIHNLVAPSEFTVDVANNQVLLKLAIAHSVRLALVIATPATHAA